MSLINFICRNLWSKNEKEIIDVKETIWQERKDGETFHIGCHPMNDNNLLILGQTVWVEKDNDCWQKFYGQYNIFILCTYIYIYCTLVSTWGL